MKANNPSKRAGDGASFPAEGVLAVLRDTLTALRSETVPAPAHRGPQELAACWNEVFEDIKKLEAAFLLQEKLAHALAAAPHNVKAAKRVPYLQRKVAQLRVEALGPVSLSGTTGQGKAGSRPSWPTG